MENGTKQSLSHKYAQCNSLEEKTRLYWSQQNQHLHRWYYDFTTLAQGPQCSSVGITHHLRCFWPFFLPFSTRGCSPIKNAEAPSGTVVLQPHHQHGFGFFLINLRILQGGEYHKCSLERSQVTSLAYLRVTGKHATIRIVRWTEYKDSPPSRYRSVEYRVWHGKCNLFGLIIFSSLEKQI